MVQTGLDSAHNLAWERPAVAAWVADGSHDVLDDHVIAADRVLAARRYSLVAQAVAGTTTQLALW